MKAILFLIPFALFSWHFSIKEMTLVNKISAEQLVHKVSRPENDTLYIVNFWATWCRPCIEELPYFEEAKKVYSDKKVKILLVNLDFLSESAKVEAFVTKKNLKNEVYQLSDTDANKWINQIDTTWDGAIPVTVFYQGGKKVLFHNGALNQSELNQKITTNIK
ncbi:MAG: TlpA disulfide reductase family protein [Cytophagaceae bacterium]